MRKDYCRPTRVVLGSTQHPYDGDSFSLLCSRHIHLQNEVLLLNVFLFEPQRTSLYLLVKHYFKNFSQHQQIIISCHHEQIECIVCIESV